MIELIWMTGVVLVAQWPTFIFAANIDGDEAVKSTASAVSVGAILAVYKVWKTSKRPSEV